MEKSKLLKEMVMLKRLIKDHENKQAITSSTNVNGDNLRNNLPKERSKGKVFFNPKKLVGVHNDDTKVSEKSSSHTSKPAGKVFINPNFRQPNLKSCGNVPQKGKEEQNKMSVHLYKNQTSNPEHGNIGSKSLSSQQPELPSNHDCKLSQLPVAQKKSMTSNSRVIFVNPAFSSSSKCNPQTLFNGTPKIEQKHGSKSLNSDSKVKSRKVALNICRKRKVVIGLKDSSATESFAIDQKKRKIAENVVENANKIFVNPRFEKKENNFIGLSNVPCKSSAVRENCDSSASSSSGVPTTNNTVTSSIPVLLSGKKVISKSVSVTYPLCAMVGPDRGKQVGRKTNSQRVRTRSTSLVAVSTTKLVRKRRLSQKALESREKIIQQPVFVSKTKLVRNVSKKETKTSCVVKTRVKQPNQMVSSQISLAEKLYKIRRGSSTGSSSNLAQSTPKSAVIVKIKSKNGKSLKLIRKSIDSSSTGALKMKTQENAITKKVELRQQASRAAMCVVQSRLKRYKLSKVNVAVNKSCSPSYNINIYQKNNVAFKKPLTKAELVKKKEAAASVITKTHFRNMPLDRTKFIKSKYRLIRKQSSNTMSRYKLSLKTTNKVTRHNRLIQHKKLKWKRKSNTPKRKLTRKDLSIKKIGGVFYRYSRTTLSKNKPASKQVSQPQWKEIRQVTSTRRENRFCLNRNPVRKRTDSSRGYCSTWPSGMSWRRASHCSASSILTQAKQKSITLLSKKLKKNNEPCLFFHRHGRCSGLERGTCVRLHDKKYVAVCKKFLQGLCTDEKCSLNHSPDCHNMPTCHHFLAGQCGRDHCPYPHIKVNDSAPICVDFLKGYCALGDQCPKRHFEICPSFEKGVCARGKYCPYPHPKNKVGEKFKGRFKNMKRKLQPLKEIQPVSTPSLRYFEDVNLQKENQEHLIEDKVIENNDTEVEEEEVEDVVCLRRRPQLGELPSFIPLSQGDDT